MRLGWSNCFAEVELQTGACLIYILNAVVLTTASEEWLGSKHMWREFLAATTAVGL